MEELDRVLAGRNAEFIVEGGDTNAVLPDHQLLLMLCRIASHEDSVNRLAARVTAHRELAEMHGLGKLAELEMHFRDALERL